MMVASNMLSLLALALSVSAAPVLEKRASCPSYTIITTRGTGIPQGDDFGLKNVNAAILAKLPGGKVYNTVYPAGWDQQSGAGTADIVNKVNSVLATNPSECFLLSGYSQGAAATTNALPRLQDPATFAAIKGVYLIGNPLHKAGLPINVDNNGGDSSKDVNGISAYTGVSVPQAWFGKTLDVCIKGDGVCDTTNGVGINFQHLQYMWDEPAMTLGTNFGVKVLS